MVDESSNEHKARLYATLFDAIPSSVLVLDRGLRVLSANRNFFEKSRSHPSSTLGFPLSEVFPPGILDHTNIVSHIRQAFAINRPSRGERMTYRTPGQPIRYYYYRVIPFLENGVVEKVLLLMDDVTEPVLLSQEVRKAERHLASVVECAHDIVLSTSVQGTLLTWNGAAERLTGYRMEEIKERSFFDFCTDMHRELAEQAFENIRANGGPQAGEWHIVSKSGEIIPVSWACSSMCDEMNGRITGIVAVGRDLTEYRKLERQLVQSQKLAALGVMAGGIAHEIRNPLAICFSAAQFLAEHDITEEFRRECVENIRIATSRASMIIESVLRFARPSAHDDLSPVDVVQILDETIQLIGNQATTRNIELIREVPARAVLVKGIANQLQQVFMNLFVNAMDAMPSGGFLRVRVEQNASDVRIYVEDSGCGIPEADIDKIFDPFYTTSPAGTGLGLSICYSIVKEHKGTIEVQSDLNRGTIVTVCLPRLLSNLAPSCSALHPSSAS